MGMGIVENFHLSYRVFLHCASSSQWLCLNAKSARPSGAHVMLEPIDDELVGAGNAPPR